jgi:hypothetical protein
MSIKRVTQTIRGDTTDAGKVRLGGYAPTVAPGDLSKVRHA